MGIVGPGGVVVVVVALALYAAGDFVVATGLGVWNEMTVNWASNFVSGEGTGSAEDVVEWTSVYTGISVSVGGAVTSGGTIDCGSAAVVVGVVSCAATSTVDAGSCCTDSELSPPSTGTVS